MTLMRIGSMRMPEFSGETPSADWNHWGSCRKTQTSVSRAQTRMRTGAGLRGTI